MDERDDYAELDSAPTRLPTLRSVLILTALVVLGAVVTLTWFWFAVLLPACDC